VIATVVVIAVLLVVYGDKNHPPQWPRTTSGTSSTAVPATSAGPSYINCSAARADGRSNIPRGDPAYRPDLDHNGDGIACEG
jgi:hypothetical protein